MKTLKFVALAGLLAALPALAAAPVLDHTYRRLAAKEQVNLRTTYGGDVLLVVNTASKCGYTPQYEGLEKLQKEMKGKGFNVLGFPSNDFGGQEPGTAQEIATFCRLTYGVTFPMFEKVVTRKGAGQSPIYIFLGAFGQLPAWNFSKYVVDKQGRVVAFFPSEVTPEDPALRAALAKALAM